MGRKSKRKNRIQPFCYYCDREFESEQFLINHQKARHFKCSVCYKKMATSNSLYVHMGQVHKESISKVPNAIEGRNDLDIFIFGMEGVPEDILIAKGKKPRIDYNQPQSAPTPTTSSSGATAPQPRPADQNIPGTFPFPFPPGAFPNLGVPVPVGTPSSYATPGQLPFAPLGIAIPIAPGTSGASAPSPAPVLPFSAPGAVKSSLPFTVPSAPSSIPSSTGSIKIGSISSVPADSAGDSSVSGWTSIESPSAKKSSVSSSATSKTSEPTSTFTAEFKEI